MTSNRLAHVYRSSLWKGPIRRAVLAGAQGRCQWVWWDAEAMAHLRCSVMDKTYGGAESLTVDHIDPHGGEALTNLAALCRKHHGKKDGGRAGSNRRGGVRLW